MKTTSESNFVCDRSNSRRRSDETSSKSTDLVDEVLSLVDDEIAATASSDDTTIDMSAKTSFFGLIKSNADSISMA